MAQHTSMSIHTLNGKVEAEMKGHKQPIKRFEINTMHNFILSQSHDLINLWSISNHQRMRSIFAHNSSFMDSKFTPDGSMLATLFKDSSLYFWNLSSFEADYKISTIEKELQLDVFDLARNMKFMVAGGKTPFVILFDLQRYFSDGHLV